MENEIDPMFYWKHFGVSYGCGLTGLGDFKFLPTDVYTEKNAKDYREHTLGKIPEIGTGYVVAAFIPNRACEEAKKLIAQQGWKEVFRSEERKNKNSDNPFYFVIYDTTKGPDDHS